MRRVSSRLPPTRRAVESNSVRISLSERNLALSERETRASETKARQERPGQVGSLIYENAATVR